jgi:predicted ATPase with chaperone activity
LKDTGISPAVLRNLALKALYTVPQATTEWAARLLCLPHALVAELLEDLRTEQLLEILGSSGPFGYRYSISGRGRERAARLLEISGYIGPAPVSLEAYTAMLEWQLARTPEVTSEHVSGALGDLVLGDQERLLAGLAATSRRSLFLFGPPGNGKTSVGRMIHSAFRGNIWVPHCIGIDENIIRIYDPHVHEIEDIDPELDSKVDRRWQQIRRPLIVGGGEMTLESFDLTYSASHRYYEAPLHLKANGGTFLIDDYGRQRIDPHQLLNRWIIPLEHRIDYLTLHNGQKIQVPFQQFLIIATNMDLGVVTDPAFLRRMGYRLHLAPPSPEQYRQIFENYTEREGFSLQAGLVDRILKRYEAENRELRRCEPRDLVERARDICRFTGLPENLDDSVLDLAWNGYFGTRESER